ncbi:MAG: hypothetical protein OXF42_06260 [Candidatus Dadabacteria bacterium]|nr:hypothetical protein [Candidatus Dadabacteria bacterium]
MANNANRQELYWTGGQFRFGLEHPNESAPDSVSAAIATIEEFRTACHKQYIAFYCAVTGRNLAHEKFKELAKSRDNRLFVGTQFPNAEQQPGHSCIAQLKISELLDRLVSGGEFESEHAKALIVMIFSLWEENYRHSIAEAMSVRKNQVSCALMNDIRHVRNCILHDNGIVSDGFADKLNLLSQIWKITSGELRITRGMLHSLMEQINALRVKIEPETTE